MSRDEFMRELEYLLQDIPDEDKADAIAYYRDYLEEAGSENEDSAIREFGSPERVAAIIRADLNGNLEQGGEFTDQGYEDERFKEPNYSITPRLDLPEERAGETGGNRRYHYGENRPEDGKEKRKGRRRWEWWQILLLCLAAPVLLPIVLGLGGGALGLVFGVGSGAVGILTGLAVVLLCLAIALPAVTLGILMAGVVLIIFGVTHLTVMVQGILYIGTGVGLFGLGMLFLSLCGLYYGRFLPWLGIGMINGVNRLIHRKKVTK